MALRCLTSLGANGKIVKLLQLTSEAMASIWATDRSDYNWYNSTSSAPTEYIVSEGDDILEDLFTREWVSSGETDYEIINSRNSYFFKKYDTQVGSRNSVGIQPYDYGSSDIYGRYQQGELAILHYQYAIIIDDENEEAVIVFYQTRNGSGYSTFYRFTVYTGNNYRHTLWLDFTDAQMTYNGGGAGSGYIGNSLLSNKKMVGYNVPTSSAEGTKTESVNDVSASAVSGKPKSGNGFARIKFLRDAWGGEEVPILWAGNSNKMTVQISNNKIVFKLYSGNLLIYSFDAYVGATIIDADNIYVHFLIDSEQELAKPSMIYDNNSVLSYNQEEPTDEEMADIYTWVSAGLPSE